MNSLDIAEFRGKLVKVINDEPAPMELKRMIVADVLKEVERVAMEEIKVQLEAKETAEEEEQDELPEENVGC